VKKLISRTTRSALDEPVPASAELQTQVLLATWTAVRLPVPPLELFHNPMRLRCRCRSWMQLVLMRAH
jgi:hypothetical protein